VFVANVDLEVGDALEDAGWRSESRPAALVPEGAIDSPPSADSLATARIVAGEVLVGERLATSGAGSSVVPPGRSAVDLRLEREPLGIGVGDHVNVLAAADPLVALEGNAASSTPEALVVARDAVVLSSTRTEPGHMLTVAVTDADLSSTAAASMSGAVVVVKRNPSG
jgi:Flp pilus assembly protein CpaB